MLGGHGAPSESEGKIVSLRQIARLSAGQDPLAVGDAAGAKVGLSAQAAKDVANVVFGRDAGLEGAVPVLEHALDDLDAGVENVVNGYPEAVLVRDAQVVVGADARGRTVKVGA
jgi:predicted alpha/beta hydrolase